jgi:hypothetical protein
MTMYANGTTAAATEDEAAAYTNPEDFSSPEATEWEDEAHFSSPELHEWETHESHESHYSNPYSNPEDEQEGMLGAIGSALGFETEDELSHYTTPETEWEDEAATEAHYASPEAHEFEDERDQFLPFLAPLAAKAIPLIGRAVLPLAKRLIPAARRAVPAVLRSVLGQAGGPPPRPGMPMPAPVARQARSRPTPFGPARPPFPATFSRRQRATVAGLLRRLAALFGEGEAEAAELEAQLFGANELEGELAAHEHAHEAALTEVLAAEAAHTHSEGEAEALLGAALPITIRIMAGDSAVRRVMPTLARANARLVRSLRRSGPAGPQLLRTVPAIQRRAVASLRAAQRAGRPVTPNLAAQVMAGQAARVLSTPHVCGRAIVRNVSVRRATVAPPGRSVRRRMTSY